MVELREFIGNFFLEFWVITFYQRSPMDFFHFLIRASVQLKIAIFDFNQQNKKELILLLNKSIKG